MFDRVEGVRIAFRSFSFAYVQSNRVRNIHDGVFDLKGPFRLRQKRSRNQRVSSIRAIEAYCRGNRGCEHANSKDRFRISSTMR